MKKIHINKTIKFIIVLIAFFLAMFVFKPSINYGASSTTVGTITYKYDLIDGNAENVMIDDTATTEYPDLIELPNQLDGYTVVSIGDGTGCISQKTKIWHDGNASNKIAPKFVMPNTVTKINAKAFSSCYVLNTNFSQIKEIGQDAFYYGYIGYGFMPNGRTLDLSSLQTMGARAFGKTGTSKAEGIAHHYVYSASGSYNKIIFGSNLQAIGDEAFYGQDYITEVTIPSTINSIGEGAFQRCSSLENLTIENRTNQLEIKSYAFKETGLTGSINIKNIYNLGTGVFANTKLTSATIENGITAIPDETFKYSTLAQITLPQSITEIGAEALEGTKVNTTLYNQIMQNNIQTIGLGAFADCKQLTGEIVVKNTVQNLGEGVFKNCTGIETAKIQINGLTKLPNETFSGCTSLSTVELPAATVEIGNAAFKNCTSLSKEMVYNNIFPTTKSNMIVGNQSFENCTGIEGEFNVPTNIKTIGDSAFKGCTGITKLNIAGIIETIGSYAFADCENTTEVTINATALTTIGNNAFYNTAVDQEIVRINAPVTKVGTRIFTSPKEIFIGNTENRINKGYRWYGEDEPIIHYSNCTEQIEVICTLPGVTITNANTNENISNTTVNAPCEQDYTWKINIAEQYANKYDDLIIKVVSKGKYSNSPDLETTYTLSDLTNNTQTFESITRDKKITVERIENGTDLVLRNFITKLNNKDITNRNPSIIINHIGVKSFEYNHTKYPLTVKRGDVITYTIRVYNEGEVAGKANEITVRLPEGLKLVDGNSTNELYGWTANEAGNVVKSAYLVEKEISAYSGSGRPQYEEIQIVCEVNTPNTAEQALIMVAEISNGNDIDSLPDDTDSLDLSTYMKEESLASNASVYVKGIEDDTDHEYVTLSEQLEVGYQLVVKKIDSATNELLNGAKIRLYDSNKNQIKEVLTQDGEADFGAFTTYGEGTDIYYIEEVETPIGYKRTIQGLVELKVIKELNEQNEMEVTFICDINEFEEDIDEDATMNYIPITSIAELRKMGSGETLTINGEEYEFSAQANYQLQNDLVFPNITTQEELFDTSKVWIPINKITGTFDGNNHSITNVVIAAPDSFNGAGLFQEFDGVIKNLTLEAMPSTVTLSSVTDSISGKHAVAGLVGYMYNGTIQNCNITYKAHPTLGCNVGTENIGAIIGHTDPNGIVQIKNCNVTFSIPTESYTQNVGSLIGCVGGNATIINCTSEGNIGNNNGVSMGGLVGYSAQGGNVTFENCTNNVNVYCKTNCGGLIGTSMGSVTVRDCTNNGTVGKDNEQSGVAITNIGGLIGYAEPSAYSPKNMKATFANDRLTLYVTNKQKVDDYKINIYKIEKIAGLENVNMLNGAKFNVYKYDFETNEKVLVKENAIAVDGVIGLDKLPMMSETNDVFYIREVEAPDGYDILVKDDVKVQIIAKWDGVNEKYIIDPAISLINNIDTDELDEMPAVKGDEETLPISSANVKWNTNKIVVEDSVNYGKITGKMEIGGIIGAAKGNVSITNSHNKQTENNTNSFEIIGLQQLNIGGIIGNCLMTETRNEVLQITGCTNEISIIKGNTVGGIVGISYAPVYIDNCINKAETIQSTDDSSSYPISNAGGIIGATMNNVNITECSNEGNVSALARYDASAGGIIGSCTMAKGKEIDVLGYKLDNPQTLYIENCEVKGISIIGNAHSGGIVGMTIATENEINNCTVKGLTLTEAQSGAAGILGSMFTEELIMSNNNVIDCDINVAGHAGGIVGSMYPWAYGTNGNYITLVEDRSKLNIMIDNCHTYGGTINSTSKKASGIIANLYYSTYTNTNSIVNLIINNCSVEKNEDNIGTVINGKEAASGIYAGGKASGNKNFIVDLTDNNVDSAEITCSTTSMSYVSGICGHFLYDAKNYDINIERCNVTNSTLTGGTASSLIMSGIYPQAPLKLNIQDCNTENNTITAYTANVGGIIGYMQMYSYKDNTTIKNCNVKDLTIDYKADDSNHCCGGIAGMLYCQNEDLLISDCTVENLKIKRGSLNVGGIAGHLYGGSNDKKEIVNCKVIGKQTEDGVEASRISPSTITENIGGILASSMASGKNVSIKNCEVSDLEILADDGNKANMYAHGSGLISVGGAIGNIYDVNEYENITVKNINFNMYIYNTIGNVGGFAGGLVGFKNPKINNIKVDNAYIEVNMGAISGVIGDLCQNNAEMTNIELSNSTIKATYLDMQPSRTSGSVSGILAKTSSDSLDMNKIKVKNVLIDTVGGTEDNNRPGAANAGILGVMATGDNSIKMSEIDINGLIINSTNNSTRTVAGIAGILGANSVIEDATLKDVQINIATNRSKISSYINKAYAGAIAAVVSDGNNRTERYGHVSKINNIKMDNVEINNECEDIAISGGVATVGYLEQQYSNYIPHTAEIEMSDIEAKNLKLNGKYIVGGILGTGIGKLSNIKVINPQINSTIATQTYDRAIGMQELPTAGGAVGIAVEGSELSDITVTADQSNVSADTEATDVNTTKYGIFSDYFAGGIAGFNSGLLKDSKVENIIVKTGLQYQEPQEPAPGEGETPETDVEVVNGSRTDDILTPGAHQIQAKSLQEYINTTVTNVKVILKTVEKIVNE